MMKKFILAIFWVMMSTMVFAQSKNIKITLVDGQSGEKISGAVIFYNNNTVTSDKDGQFTILLNDQKDLQLSIQHLGYENFEKKFERSELVKNPRIELKSSLLVLEEVLISGDRRPLVSQRKFDRETVLSGDPKNIGDIFKDKSSFGLIKRGGYAMDPVFRSFKYEQLNLIYDGGVYITNACPNRMDPASTQISPAEIDRIELVKGPFSVRYGQTMGGLINIITNRPATVEEFRLSGDFEGGYEMNGNGITGRGSILAAGKLMDLSVQGGVLSFDDYKNGEGQEVPSSFQTYNYALKYGYNITQEQRLQVSWRQSFGKNIAHAALPMDSPKDNSSILSLDYGAKNLGNVIKTLNAKGFYTFVDHLMTNEGRPNFRMVEASSPVTSTTYGGRLELGLQRNPKILTYLGADWRYEGKDGVRNRKVKMMNGNPLDPPREFVDLIWQDSWMNDIGIFAESSIYAADRWDFLVGARIDYVTSGANDPAVDFEQQYGSIETKSEWNFSLNGNLNRYFGSNGLIQLSIGRGQRAASLLERYINHFTVGMDAYEYVGNPNLESEVNNQVDLTVRNALGKFSWRANVFYSYLQNYISAEVDEDLQRKYMPGTEPLFAKRFINIDKAWQTGFDAEIGYNFTKSLSISLGGYYTYAQNVDFDEPLPEIPPLTGLASIRFDQPRYWLELKGRFAAEQNRVAASFDESETPGFNVFDLTAAYKPHKNVNLNFALRNIFNANYYEHLSRPYKNQSEKNVLYEPGRSFRIGLNYRF